MSKQPESPSSEKLQEALELLNQAAHDKRDEVKQLVHSKYGDLKATMVGAEGRAAEWVGDATEKVTHARDVGQEHLQETFKALDQRVHNNPWKALCIVAAGSLLVGYIIGRK